MAKKKQQGGRGYVPAGLALGLEALAQWEDVLLHDGQVAVAVRLPRRVAQGVVNPLKQMGLLHIPGAVDEGDLLADLVHRVDRHGGGRATAARQPASASLADD